jgi:hypothetical protein
VEANSYRWTMGKFSVVLQPPPSPGGAKLVLRFYLPEPVIARRKAVTLSASVEGLGLPPERYTAAGDYTYARDIPASSLPDRPVKIDFSLDRYLAAGEIELRELGITVMRVALAAK